MDGIAKWINDNIVLVEDVIKFPPQDYMWFVNTFNNLPALNKHVFINCNENQEVVGIYFNQKWGDKLLELIKEIFFRELIKKTPLTR